MQQHIIASVQFLHSFHFSELFQELMCVETLRIRNKRAIVFIVTSGGSPTGVEVHRIILSKQPFTLE